MKKLAIILTWIVWMVGLTAAAHTEAVVADTTVDLSLKKTRGMSGFSTFDPTIYQVQKRYRPTEHDTAYHRKWWRKFIVGASSGVSYVNNLHASTFQTPLQVFLGYRFNPVHQLRVQAGYMKMEEESEYQSHTTFSGELQYLANLSNFVSGYEPKRPVDVSTMIGAGVRRYNTGIPHVYVPYARAGFDVSMRVGPNMAIFAQPYVGLSYQQSGLFTVKDPSPVNIIYGVDAGISARFDDSRTYYKKMSPMYRSFFFEGSTGWGFNLDGFNMAQSGSNEKASIGRWFDPVLGLRLGVMGQQGYWSRETYQETEHYKLAKHHAMLGVSGELLVNLTNLSPKNRRKVLLDEENPSTDNDPKFEIDLGLGGMYGYNAKTDVPDVDGVWRCYYYGFTTSLQALYKVAPGSYFFVEPRFFNNYYRRPYDSKELGRKIETDRFVSFSVGARVYAAPRPVRMLNDNKFTTNWWVGAGAGGMKMFEKFHISEDGFNMAQPSFSLDLGYDVHPMATGRLQLEWSSLARIHNNWNTRYQMLDMRAMYMLPFSNLLRGVDSGRRFNTYLGLGPSISFIVGQDSKEGPGELAQTAKPKYTVGTHTLGAAGSVMLTYAFGKTIDNKFVSSPWDIYLEVQGQYNKDYAFTPEYNTRLNRLRWSLGGGVRYHLLQYLPDKDGKKHWNVNLPDYMKGWYMEGSTGWIVPLRGTAKYGLQEGSFLHRSGAIFNYRFGRWVKPWLGLRVGLQAQQHTSNTLVGVDDEKHRNVINYDASASAMGTVELLANPLNFSKRFVQNHADRKFDLNMAIGFQGGFIGLGDNAEGDVGRSAKRVTGFTASLQPMFKITPGTWLFLEPRYTSLHYESDGLKGALYPRTILHTMAINFGARIVRPDWAHSRRNWTDEENGFTDADDLDAFTSFDKFAPHWWFGIQAGGMRDLDTRKVIGDGRGVPIQPTFSINAAYDFHPLATLRGQFDYSRLGAVSPITDQNLYNNLYNIRLIYMLNINNLWQNTRRWPRFSAYPEIGVSWAHHNRNKLQSRHNIEGQKDAFGLMLGAMFAYRITPQWDIDVETQEQYHWPHGFVPAQNGHGKLGNGLWNLTAGFRYHMRPGAVRAIDWQNYKPDWLKGWFVEAGYGLNVPLYTGYSAEHMMGNSWHASFGHWLSSWFGMRTGLAGSTSYWMTSHTPASYEPLSGMQIHGEYNEKKAEWNAAVRTELLVKPLNFFKSFRHAEEPRFDFNLSAGIDLGMQCKTHVEGKKPLWRHNFIGFTTSVQGLYRLTPGIQVYAEPRYHTASYKVGNDIMLTNDRAAERYFDFNVGVRITRRAPSVPYKNVNEDTPLDNTAFHPHLWAGVNVNGLKLMHGNMTYTSGIGWQPTFGLNVGYDLTPLSGFRLQAQYAQSSIVQSDLTYSVTTPSGSVKRYTGNFNQHLGILNIRGLYMLNFTNLWRGTRGIPRLATYFEIGPSYSRIIAQRNTLIDGEMAGGSKPTPIAQYKGNQSMGIVTGINMAWRVHTNWDVTIESLGQCNFKRPYLPVVDRSAISNVMFEFGLGTRYHF